MSGISYTNNEDDYSIDYENEDFEDFDSPSNKSFRKITTPYQKSPKQLQYKSDSEEEEEEQEAQRDNKIDGQDLETYMKSISNLSKNNNLLSGNNDQISSEFNPLDGLVPNKNNTDEEQLRIKLGYSSSPSPDKKSLRFQSENHLQSSLSKHHEENESKKNIVEFNHAILDDDENLEDDYITNFKKLLNESPSKKAQKTSRINYNVINNHNKSNTDIESPNTISNSNSNVNSNTYTNIDTLIHHTNTNNLIPHHHHTRKEPAYSKDNKENAERVDALLMELFPERFEQQKKRQSKPTKKSNYQKNQVFGLGAISSEYLASSSAGLAPGSDNLSNKQLTNRDVFSADDTNDNNYTYNNVNNNNSISGVLEQQIKLLKKELKSKDEKISRLTDHAVMMGNHMDKLKGENAQLSYNLREAQLEIEAKDARLNQVIRLRKKAAKKKNASINEGQNESSLENEITHLKEREVALLDAIEELSNQNEDLILKLKESMERELIQSSKRAAQINQNITSIVLPSIGGGASVGREHIENNQNKRNIKKKK